MSVGHVLRRAAVVLFLRILPVLLMVEAGLQIEWWIRGGLDDPSERPAAALHVVVVGGSCSRTYGGELERTLQRRKPPVDVRVDFVGADPRTYEMKVARIPQLTPSLLATAIISAIDANAQVGGDQTVDMRLAIAFEDHPSLEIEQSFDGPAAAVSVIRTLLNVSFPPRLSGALRKPKRRCPSRTRPKPPP